MKTAALCGVGLIAALTLAAITVLASQTVGAAMPETTVTAVADFDGKHAEFTGAGECHHTTTGTIYGAPATMWHASFRGGSRNWSYANLSIWQLKRDGSVQTNLSASAGAASYEVATVKGGAIRGRATGRAEMKGAGGTVFAKGQTADGKSVRISIVCTRFEAPEDNGD